MPDTTAAKPTPNDQLKELQSEADALAKAQTAAANDVKAMQKAFEDREKEIAAYVAEHDKLENDTNLAKERLANIVARIKGHSPDVAQSVDETVIEPYDADLETKHTALEQAETKANETGVAMKDAEKTAAEKQADFEFQLGRRIWAKGQLAVLDKAVKAGEAKDDDEAYAEAYAIAKVPVDDADELPTVDEFRENVRGAWELLRAAREELRAATDVWVRAVRKRDDLRATIAELEAKRAENILAKVISNEP